MICVVDMYISFLKDMNESSTNHRKIIFLIFERYLIENLIQFIFLFYNEYSLREECISYKSYLLWLFRKIFNKVRNTIFSAYRIKHKIYFRGPSVAKLVGVGQYEVNLLEIYIRPPWKKTSPHRLVCKNIAIHRVVTISLLTMQSW